MHVLSRLLAQLRQKTDDRIVLVSNYTQVPSFSLKWSNTMIDNGMCLLILLMFKLEDFQLRTTCWIKMPSGMSEWILQLKWRCWKDYFSLVLITHFYKRPYSLLKLFCNWWTKKTHREARSYFQFCAKLLSVFLKHSTFKAIKTKERLDQLFDMIFVSKSLTWL